MYVIWQYFNSDIAIGTWEHPQGPGKHLKKICSIINRRLYNRLYNFYANWFDNRHNANRNNNNEKYLHSRF